MKHLSSEALEVILNRLPNLTIGVLGDLFLDRYLDLDASLTEPSLETGLDAYQVVGVRGVPGAAGTVLNNLVALGVGQIVPISILGDDAEGFELRQALSQHRAVVLDHLRITRARRTPTYMKPMLNSPGVPARELNRLDIKNRSPLSAEDIAWLAERIERLWPSLDGLVVLDQVSEPDCGVITGEMRTQLSALGQRDPAKPVLADSRERIGLFRNVLIKPNERECVLALGQGEFSDEAIARLTARTGRCVFCTAGPRGIAVSAPGGAVEWVPAVAVDGPIDTVGAGDSTSAAILSALAAGASTLTAASLGNLVASVTIQKLGETGTASPAEVRARHVAIGSEG